MILIDNKEVKFGRFPNGEMNLNFNNIEVTKRSLIQLKYENDKDLFNLYILKTYINDLFGVVKTVNLEIFYMPYSRMDRRNQFYTFNLKYVCDFINKLNFKYVTVYDAHSDVTPALLNRCILKTSIGILFKKFRDEIREPLYDLSIMFPDAGAQKRYESVVQGYNTLVGFKSRNFETGAIDKFSIHGNIPKGGPVVILDDLCSKGGTFIGAAKALKELGAGDIYLIVGHCENTIFQGEIFNSGLIKKVYTTNSITNGISLTPMSKLYIHKLYEVINE